ncbi:MAG TPA: twin-arginine translocase subunit TatC [Anaerolineaceae bacterium]|nr:twin-arginine translocase subunit TatC [Anaerolineaceae bacterium]
MSEDEKKLMPFWDHIEELRKRLLIALVALGIATLISFLFAEDAVDVLTQPIGGISALQSIEVTENIGVFTRVSLLCGGIIAMPVILYEIMAFIMPGLKASERKWLFTGLIFGTIFFIAGVLFAYYIMLPRTLEFLVTFMGVQTVPRFSSYIKFITNMIFWMGVSFEMPLIIFVLAKLKVVSAPQLLKGWRYAIIVIAVLSAVITPTVDPVNMGLLMLPLIALYFISVLFAYLAGGKEKTPEEKTEKRTT